MTVVSFLIMAVFTKLSPAVCQHRNTGADWELLCRAKHVNIICLHILGCYYIITKTSWGKDLDMLRDRKLPRGPCRILIVLN